MGVPYFKVKNICEEAGAVLFSSNFTLYRDISARVMQALSMEVGFCEIYSIDEAFFTLPEDITEEDVHAMCSRITRNVGVPVSIGLSSTKTLAKQASSIAKKGNGVCILDYERWEVLKDTTPCATVWNLGRQTSAKLRDMGIETVAQFLTLDPAVVRSHFGVSGERLQRELNGRSVYEVDHTTDDIQQSIMSTRSFEKTTMHLSDLESSIAYHVSFAAEKLREKKLVASHIYVALLPSRHGDFMMQNATGEVELSQPTSNTQELLREALRKARGLYKEGVPYKKVGIVLGGLMPEVYVNGCLFEQEEKVGNVLDRVVDDINQRFGHGALRSAVIGPNPTRTSAKLRSKEYTTKWKDIPSVLAK